uniref:Uncharacterized protein n=1 Tax=Romanomermis culicivorax TaxID=13658 RepID=A0A915JW86_ROMCU
MDKITSDKKEKTSFANKIYNGHKKEMPSIEEQILEDNNDEIIELHVPQFNTLEPQEVRCMASWTTQYDVDFVKYYFNYKTNCSTLGFNNPEIQHPIMECKPANFNYYSISKLLWPQRIQMKYGPGPGRPLTEDEEKKTDPNLYKYQKMLLCLKDPKLKHCPIFYFTRQHKSSPNPNCLDVDAFHGQISFQCF